MKQVYQSFESMVSDVMEYSRSHPGCILLSSDDPVARIIGFVSVEEDSRLWQWPFNTAVRPCEFWSDLFQDQTRRLSLAASLSRPESRRGYEEHLRKCEQCMVGCVLYA